MGTETPADTLTEADALKIIERERWATPATFTSGSTTPLCGHCGRPVINTPAVVYGGVAYHTECTRSPYAADEIERLRAERDEAIAAARHLKNLVTSPLTEEDKEWARETMSDTNLARMPRDLATILRTEARNQRTPPIDYAVAEDGGRMVVHPEPDIAMAELLEEAATALAAKNSRIAELEATLSAARAHALLNGERKG